MITATLILAALTLLIATDEPAAHDDSRVIPVESKDRDPFTS